MREVIESRVEGKYPPNGYESLTIKDENVTVQAQRHGDCVLFRMKDKVETDFWLELEISVDELRKLLEE
jgi:hypothetical protein